MVPLKLGVHLGWCSPAQLLHTKGNGQVYNPLEVVGWFFIGSHLPSPCISPYAQGWEEGAHLCSQGFI